MERLGTISLAITSNYIRDFMFRAIPFDTLKYNILR
jgi:hypothetical protein